MESKARMGKSNGRYKHGDDGTILHSRWKNMKSRVKSGKDYTHVTVYESWNTYVNFRDWALANGFNESTNHTSIEREDSLGNYEPSNCKIVIFNEDQNKNRRNCKWWFVYGVKYETSKEAADFHGVSPVKIRHWCDGHTQKYKDKVYHYPPKENCWSELKYPD